MNGTHETLWTGRLELQVVGFNGYPIGLLELVLRADTVDLWLHHRHRATHDRDQLREWLVKPDGVLRVDEVTWAVVGDAVEMHLANGPSHVLPGAFVEDLRCLV